MKTKLLLIPVMLLLVMNIAFADNFVLKHADNETLADAGTHSNQADTNFGTVVNVLVAWDNDYKPYFMFNTSIASDCTKVTDASFGIVLTYQESLGDIDIFLVNDTWDEAVITYNNQPCGTAFDNEENCNLTSIDTTTITSSLVRYYWNVTSAVDRKVVSDNWENVSFVLRKTGANLHGQFSSKEHATVQNRPILNITCDILIPVFINNTKPNITVNYPINHSTIGNTTEYPLLIYGNVTVQNGTLNNTTINNTNWKNIGNQTYFNFTMNGTIAEGIHYFNITSISEYGNQTSILLQFTLDLTEPAVKSSLSNNNTLIYAYENLTYQINSTDSEKVYSLNVSTETYNFEVTGVNTTKYIYNGSINVSTFGVGKHTLTTVTCDAHTKNKIKDWAEVLGADNRITYNFGNDYFFIRPLDPTLINSFSTEKQNDRYSFTYTKNPTNKKEDIAFIVSSSQYIDILGNDKKYSAWLVIPKLQKWIDFNTESRKKLKYEITRLSDYSVLVTIKGIKEDTITFNSAGTLNCIQKDYAYYIYNYSVNYDPVVTSSTPTTIDLSITYKDIVLNSTGIVSYNYTAYIPANTSTLTHFNYTINITPQQYTTVNKDINFTWNYTLNNTPYITLNYTQTVQSIFLNYYGNLSNASAINFTFWDETNDTNLTANINGKFNYLTSSVFNVDLTDTTNLTVAIYPPSASTTGDYELFYSKTGYPERRYAVTSALYNSNTQVVKLYLLAEGEGAYTTFKIVDLYANPLDEVTGTMQKLIGGSLVTVEQQTSDGSGIMTFFVDPDDDYTFSFSKVGYVTFDTTIRPITTELYTITLEAETTTQPPPYSTGITYSFSPINQLLNNNTPYNFTINLTSDYWDITACTLDLKNTTETLATSSSSFTTRNCFIRIERNTGNQTKLISYVTYGLNGTVEEYVSMEYNIEYTYKGEFSLMNFIDDIKGFNQVGFNNFTRMFLTFLIIFAVISYASSEFASFRDPETLIMLTWGLVLFFSYIGFLTLNYVGIANLPNGIWLQQYIIFIMVTLGGASYIIRRHI